MTTYSETFSNLNRAALIPFFMIGDPDIERSFEIVKTALDAGADILELGIPFSDPIADGPTIQKAAIRAADGQMTVAKARDFIRQIKEYRPVPIGLLMYYNLIYQYGVERFFEDFSNAGVDSVLIADLSIDDAGEIKAAAEKAGMNTVFMVTPVTAEERMKRIAQLTTGFIYTVSLLGVTGSRDQLSVSVNDLVGKLKKLTDVPVCVGFGISSADHAVSVARAGADGVIIGSKIVQMIEDNLDDQPRTVKLIDSFIREVKAALENM